MRPEITPPIIGANEHPLVVEAGNRPPLPPRNTKSMPSLLQAAPSLPPRPEVKVIDQVAKMKLESRNSVFEEDSSHMPIELMKELASSRQYRRDTEVIPLSERPKMNLPQTSTKQGTAL